MIHRWKSSCRGCAAIPGRHPREAACERLNAPPNVLLPSVLAFEAEAIAEVHLQYNPSRAATTKLAIVGKGLTCDSGSYNFKTGPGCMLELMKFDMGGAAAVLGCAKAILAMKPAGVEVHFIVAACENMISGGGMRPGDFLTATDRKHVYSVDELAKKLSTSSKRGGEKQWCMPMEESYWEMMKSGNNDE